LRREAGTNRTIAEKKMKIKTIAALCSTAALLAALPVSLNAQDDDLAKDLQKQMKGVGKVMKGLKAEVDAKNSDKTAADGAKLAEFFGKSATYWEKNKVEDATKWTKQAVEAAKDFSAAAKAGDWDKVKAAQGAMGKTCQSCHKAHREKLDDGGYKIK
jgi:cytochrome c556